MRRRGVAIPPGRLDRGSTPPHGVEAAPPHVSTLAFECLASRHNHRQRRAICGPVEARLGAEGATCDQGACRVRASVDASTRGEGDQAGPPEGPRDGVQLIASGSTPRLNQRSAPERGSRLRRLQLAWAARFRREEGSGAWHVASSASFGNLGRHVAAGAPGGPHSAGSLSTQSTASHLRAWPRCPPT